MRAIAAALAANAVLAMVCAASPARADDGGKAPAWTEFVSDEGRFAAAFPGTPTADAQRAPRPDGSAVEVRSCALDAGDRAYSVSWVDDANGVLGADAAAVLDDAERSLGEGKTLISKKRIELSGRFPGREVVARTNEFQIFSRVYFASKPGSPHGETGRGGGRLYTVVFACETERAGEHSTEALRFLGSFRVVEPGAIGAPYVSNDGGFTIAFASPPKVEVRKVPIAGNRVMEAHSHFVDAGGLAQSLTYVGYPQEDLGVDAVEKILDGGRDGLLKTARLIGEKRIDIGGFPGRDVEAEARDAPFYLRARFYFARNRMYTITALVSKDEAAARAGEIAKFLDSFRLLEPAGGWSEVVSADGAFAVQLPGTPVSKRERGDFSMTTTHEDLVIFVALFFFPSGEAGPQAALDVLAEKAVGRAQDAVVEKIRLGDPETGIPGREIARPGDRPGTFCVERLFLAGERLYVIHVEGPRAREDAVRDAGKRAFGSFRLLK